MVSIPVLESDLGIYEVSSCKCLSVSFNPQSVDISAGPKFLSVGKTLTVRLLLSSRSCALVLSFQCGLHSEMLLLSSLRNSNSFSSSSGFCLWGGGGVLPYERLMEMCRWMRSHVHDWIDYNEVRGFSKVTKMGSHIFGISWIRKFW